MIFVSPQMGRWNIGLSRRCSVYAQYSTGNGQWRSSLAANQPFHDGHRALIAEDLKRVGQASIAVRDTHGIDEKNPYEFGIRQGADRTCAARIRRATLDHSVQSISATNLRERLSARN
jgi:hypothetical protein